MKLATHYLLALAQPEGSESRRYVFEVQKN